MPLWPAMLFEWIFSSSEDNRIEGWGDPAFKKDPSLLVFCVSFGIALLPFTLAALPFKILFWTRVRRFLFGPGDL